MPTNRQTDKQNVVFLYNSTLLGNRKECDTQYGCISQPLAEQKQPDVKEPTVCNPTHTCPHPLGGLKEPSVPRTLDKWVTGMFSISIGVLVTWATSFVKTRYTVYFVYPVHFTVRKFYLKEISSRKEGRRGGSKRHLSLPQVEWPKFF